MAKVEIIPFPTAWAASFFLSFVWRSPRGDSPLQRECGCSSFTRCRATLSVHCCGMAPHTSNVLAKVQACVCANTNCKHEHILCSCPLTTTQGRVVKERTRESEEQRVDLRQVLKLCINGQDLLDCLCHFYSVGSSVSSLIFNKTSQPSNAFPPPVSRY